MSTQKELLFVPSPIIDESLLSYVYRLSLVNNYDLKWVYTLLGLNASKTRDYQKLGKVVIETSVLSEITEINENDLKKLSLNIQCSDTLFQNAIDRFAISSVKKSSVLYV
jgi:hypothetical protein